MILRPYQEKIINEVRSKLSSYRTACIQLCTGAGKTPIMASICSRVMRNNKTAWIVVPRVEL